MITSKNWYEHMSEDMVLKDFRTTTRESYESAIRLFLEWAKVEPLTLSEDMVRNYVLYLRENKKLSASSVNVATCALRFFFTYTVPREWPVFELLRVRIPEKLPVVLAPTEARAVLGRWLDRQRELLLPVTYFHVVVTLPSELRRLVRQHQRALLPVLFQAAFESLAVLCADPRWLGGQVGALAVLHTWTRTLEWHPHVHLLVPGGALAPDGKTWLRPPPRLNNYLLPERALAKRFRGRFLALARHALPAVRFPEIPWGESPRGKPRGLRIGVSLFRSGKAPLGSRSRPRPHVTRCIA